MEDRYKTSCDDFKVGKTSFRPEGRQLQPRILDKKVKKRHFPLPRQRKALNLSCSSGAAQWPAGHAKVIQGSFCV